MFLNLAQASPEKNIACQTVVSELESISFDLEGQPKRDNTAHKRAIVA